MIYTYRYLFFGTLKILYRWFILKNGSTVDRITMSVTLLVQKNLLFDALGRHHLWSAKASNPADRTAKWTARSINNAGVPFVRANILAKVHALTE